MNMSSHTDVLVVHDVPTTTSPVKVCMLLLGTARTDYRVIRSATALVDAGFSVSLIDVEPERTVRTEETIQGVLVKHIIMPSWFVPARFKPWFLFKLVWLLMLCIIQLLRTDADIYHAHVEGALLACYAVARLRRKPFIFDSPELPMSDPHVTRWHLLSALSIRLLKHILPRCAGVIAVSPPIVEEIRNRYHCPEVILVRNVPTYRVVPQSNRLREYLGLSSETHIALYQGNIQPNRGLHLLVQAAPFLKPNVVIVLMGKGFRGTPAQLEALIASEGVVERVKIIPPAPYEELLAWTASADIGLTLFPLDYSRSIRWCLPNKLFEYLMAGVPILTSQLDAIIEVVNTYHVGQIVSLLTPAGVGAAINTMLADPAALAQMRQNALGAAHHHFHWEKERTQIISLYQKILASHYVSSHPG